jgi:hypothetical protein
MQCRAHASSSSMHVSFHRKLVHHRRADVVTVTRDSSKLRDSITQQCREAVCGVRRLSEVFIRAGSDRTVPSCAKCDTIIQRRLTQALCAMCYIVQPQLIRPRPGSIAYMSICSTITPSEVYWSTVQRPPGVHSAACCSMVRNRPPLDTNAYSIKQG